MPPASTRSDAGTKAARVRENQCLSRARKREYVTSLEERLRRCEEADATLNTKIQEAAQKVAADNRVLRRLLRERLGVDEQDIDAYIRQSGESRPTRPMLKTSGRVANPTLCYQDQSNFASVVCLYTAECADCASTCPSSLEPPSDSSLDELHIPSGQLDAQATYANLAVSSHVAVSPLASVSPFTTLSADAPNSNSLYQTTLDFALAASQPFHRSQPPPASQPLLEFEPFPASQLPPAFSSSCPCETDSSFFPVADNMFHSTPCVVAFKLLRVVGSHFTSQHLASKQHYQHGANVFDRVTMDSMLTIDFMLTMDLWNGFRSADGGCVMENDVLVLALRKMQDGMYGLIAISFLFNALPFFLGHDHDLRFASSFSSYSFSSRYFLFTFAKVIVQERRILGGM
ncbi:hypothetical protein FISHEDRAFT_75280 [Fistulina hepatica ATCC 64428]|uniref:BZIP domain-containing protein n=1 Tax=Fistulina hepatica ATCC 64428 TaxID=1128425 RepID=A0A0D7A781_9AGAR|nr:hypothetical protein FISHEDRAFT_75280 [Fistulina hepatica ATCC 64428]